MSESLLFAAIFIGEHNARAAARGEPHIQECRIQPLQRCGFHVRGAIVGCNKLFLRNCCCYATKRSMCNAHVCENRVVCACYWQFAVRLFGAGTTRRIWWPREEIWPLRTTPVPAPALHMATVSDLATLTAAVAKLTKSVEETNAENVEMKNDLNSFYLMWAGARVVAARAHRKDEWC